MSGQNMEGTLGAPNWKQWLPVYGIVQVFLDGERNKPVIITRSPLHYFGSLAYQTASVILLAAGATELVNRLL